MTLFGNRVFADVIGYDEVILERGWSKDTGVLIRRESRQAGRRPCDDRAEIGVMHL